MAVCCQFRVKLVILKQILPCVVKSLAHLAADAAVSVSEMD